MAERLANTETGAINSGVGHAPNRTADRRDRLSHRHPAQAIGTDEQVHNRQEREALAFLCAVEVMDSGWDDWQDTLAAFNAASAACELPNA